MIFGIDNDEWEKFYSLPNKYKQITCFEQRPFVEFVSEFEKRIFN